MKPKPPKAQATNQCNSVPNSSTETQTTISDSIQARSPPKGQAQRQIGPSKEDPPPQRLALQVKAKSKELKADAESGMKRYLLPTKVLYESKDAKAAAGVSFEEIAPLEKPQTSSLRRVVMIMGATGAGKSTLINGIANYVYEVQWEDDFRFILIDSRTESSESQTKSQTKRITAYTLHHTTLPYTLTIIDTPGFGDTEGIERDRILVKQIQALFSVSSTNHGIDQIHGIGFVVQSGATRLTHTQKYIFDSVLAVFGKDIEDKIFLMTTFADGQKPPVLEAAKEAGVPISVHFKFNNSALMASNSTSGPDDDIGSFSSFFWNMGSKNYKKFLNQHLAQVLPASLLLSRQVLQERERLEVAIEGLLPQIKATLMKLSEIEQEKRMIEALESRIAAIEEFEFEIDVLQTETKYLEPGRYVTNCLVCNMTCHYPCIFANDWDKIRCAAMELTGFCKVCPGNCYWYKHRNNHFRFEVHYVKKKCTKEDLKKKYYDAMSGKSMHESMMENIIVELKAIHMQVIETIEKARKCLQKLDEIALRPNPLSEVDYLELLIEAEKREGKLGWKERVLALETYKENAILVSTVRDSKEPDDQLLSQLVKAVDDKWGKADSMKLITGAICKVGEGFQKIGNKLSNFGGK